MSVLADRLGKLRARAAGVLRKLATRLDPPTPVSRRTARELDSELAYAIRLGNEIALRRHLHAALHRFSPQERPGDA